MVLEVKVTERREVLADQGRADRACEIVQAVLAEETSMRREVLGFLAAQQQQGLDKRQRNLDPHRAGRRQQGGVGNDREQEHAARQIAGAARACRGGCGPRFATGVHNIAAR